MDDNGRKRFGRYEVVTELGRGAMGVVYKAHDPKINRTVAVKTISLAGQDPEDEKDYRERFYREAEAAGRLSHPGIVTIFDVGEETETRTPYIVMEFVGGESLEKLMSRGDRKLPMDKALQLALELAEALECAHGQGVVHRDLKPANILMTEDGHAKIADFGVAKLNLSNQTLAGRALGTPAYMSPEQLNGDAVDGRSDLFSLGVILYTVVTGYRPFQGNSALTVSFKVVNRDPIPATLLDTELPEGLDAIITKAMAKDPAERYQSGRDMARAIKDLRDGQRSTADPDLTATMGGDDPSKRGRPINLGGPTTAGKLQTMPQATPQPPAKPLPTFRIPPAPQPATQAAVQSGTSLQGATGVAAAPALDKTPASNDLVSKVVLPPVQVPFPTASAAKSAPGLLPNAKVRSKPQLLPQQPVLPAHAAVLEKLRKRSVVGVVILAGLFILGLWVISFGSHEVRSKAAAPAPHADSAAPVKKDAVPPTTETPAEDSNSAATEKRLPVSSAALRPANRVKEPVKQAPKENAVAAPPQRTSPPPAKIARAILPPSVPMVSREVTPLITPATLEIEVDHRFAEAKLTIWVDDALTYTHALEGTDKKRLGVFHHLQGHEFHAMQISPGKHVLRVQVTSESATYNQSSTLTGEFASGQENALHISFNKHGDMSLGLQNSTSPHASAASN